MAALVALGVRRPAQPALAQDEAVGDAWAAAWSSGDGHQVAAVFADDGVYEDVPSATISRGAAGIRDWAQGYFDAFSEAAQSISAWTAIPDGALAQWLVVGTHRETGNRVSFRGASVFALANGKIRREAAYYDTATYIVQTGGACAAVTAPANGTPAAAPDVGSSATRSRYLEHRRRSARRPRPGCGSRGCRIPGRCVVPLFTYREVAAAPITPVIMTGSPTTKSRVPRSPKAVARRVDSSAAARSVKSPIEAQVFASSFATTT